MASVISFKVNDEEKEELKKVLDNYGPGKKFQDRSKAIKASIRLMVNTLE